MTIHTYIAKKSAKFLVKVLVGEVCTQVQFTEGRYETDSNEIASQLDGMIATKGLARHIQKVDREAALQLVEGHRAMQRQTGAQSGGVTALAAQTAQNSHFNKRDAELQAAAGIGVDAIIDKLDEEGLSITESGLPPLVDNPDAPPEKQAFKLNAAAK